MPRDAVAGHDPSCHAHDGAGMSGLHAMAYTSIAYPLRESELTALLEGARRFNGGVDVTGVLFHHAGRFFQYFEGPENAVRLVHGRILRSPTHHSLAVLLDAPIASRQFPSWYMGFCEPPVNEFQTIANAEWAQAMPIMRTTMERSEGLSLVLSYWSRWVADRPARPPGDTGEAP